MLAVQFGHPRVLRVLLHLGVARPDLLFPRGLGNPEIVQIVLDLIGHDVFAQYHGVIAAVERYALATGENLVLAVLFVPLGERRRHVHLLDDVAPAHARVVRAEGDFAFLCGVRNDALLGAGMWFQDLFNYDFRRTEQCIIPYATQEGEISFCAYNTGVGWRNIIEKMHMTATLTKWYEEHGRHEIFAGGKNVKMDSTAHNLVLKDEIVTMDVQHDLDKLGIAKTAREEKTRARDAKLAEARGPKKDDAAYNARMAAMYREVVLKEKPVQSEGGFIPLGALAKPNGNPAPAAKPEAAEPVLGD